MGTIGQLIKSQLRVIFSYIADFRLFGDAANKRLDVFKPNQTILKIIKFPTHPLYIVLISDDGFRMLKTLKNDLFVKLCLREPDSVVG